MRRLIPSIVLMVAACGADLDELHATQHWLIAARDSTKLLRDEAPLAEVARARRQLLFWAESRLQSFGKDADPATLTKALGQELQTVVEPRSHKDSYSLGDLDLAFSRPDGESAWLQMNIHIGLPCEADESVYLYEWRGNRWSRRFALEANSDTQEKYEPQDFVQLQLSSADSRGARLVLVTGWPPACMSVWHTLYIRLFRIDTNQTLLLEQKPYANQGEDYAARLEPNGVRVEFLGDSIDLDYLVRKHVLRYRLDRDKVRRVEPIALSPRDFVEEWLRQPWDEMSEWSDPQLAEWRQRLPNVLTANSTQCGDAQSRVSGKSPSTSTTKSLTSPFSIEEATASECSALASVREQTAWAGMS